MSLPLHNRFFLNILLFFALCLLLTAFMFRSNFILSEPPTNVVNTAVRSQSESVSIPLRHIMRSPVTLNQDDPSLIKIIREDFLNPPSKLEYNLSGETDDPSKGQSLKIRELMEGKRNGFFVECGALDGETRSNTLYFEKVLGWSGILIEGDPKNFKLVSKKQRKAWTISACLSTFPYPNVVLFQQQFNVGKISDVSIARDKLHQNKNLVEVQCLPLYSIWLAMNLTTIDYFSLDVEGHELEVLRTIPWDKVNITTLSVEFIHGKDGKLALERYMESKGYRVYDEVTFPGGLANDFIFYHPHLLNRKDI